jgi:sarcosine oxidase subunit alpha
VVADGRPLGRVTSSRVSERLGRTIGLAWVGPELAADEAEITIRVGTADERATVTHAPFYDPAGERLRS